MGENIQMSKHSAPCFHPLYAIEDLTTVISISQVNIVPIRYTIPIAMIRVFIIKEY